MTNETSSFVVVDDDRDFGQSLANFLRLEGHEVELAFDGEAAAGERKVKLIAPPLPLSR